MEYDDLEPIWKGNEKKKILKISDLLQVNL